MQLTTSQNDYSSIRRMVFTAILDTQTRLELEKF